jgi:hypothetical protein
MMWTRHLWPISRYKKCTLMSDVQEGPGVTLPLEQFQGCYLAATIITPVAHQGMLIRRTGVATWHRLARAIGETSHATHLESAAPCSFKLGIAEDGEELTFWKELARKRDQLSRTDADYDPDISRMCLNEYSAESVAIEYKPNLYSDYVTKAVTQQTDDNHSGYKGFALNCT